MLDLDLFSQNLSKPKYKCFEPFIGKGWKGMYYIYYYNYETGTRTKKTTKSKNQPGANKELSRFKLNYYKGNTGEKIKYVSELLDKLFYYYNQSHSKKTLEIYKTAFNKFMAINGNLELMQVSLRCIEDFKIRVAEVTSKTSANIYFRTLKSAFNFAKKFGYIFENPFVGVKQFPVEERQKLSFEDTDLKILFENIEEAYLKRIVFFALNSATRIGEILNIQRSDINQKSIRISNKNDFRTKNRKERNFPLFTKLMQIIDEDPYSMHEINRSVQQKINFYGSNVIEFDHKREKNYVFGKPDGTKFSTGYISRQFKECLRKAGLEEKYHFHCLRHTALTNMDRAGMPAFMIKELAGHSDIKTTQGYIHPPQSEMIKYLETIDYTQIQFGSGY